MTISSSTSDRQQAVSSIIRSPPGKAPGYWLYLFLAFQFICQAALLIEVFGSRWRIGCRGALFISSLIMLAFLPGRVPKPHPSRIWGLALLGFMGLGLLHPYANLLSGIAHWLLNIAIWAPLFWVGRIAISARTLWNALLMIWVFNVAGATLGVLQVYYPDRFSPSAEFVRATAGVLAEGLLVTLADGSRVWRPCGLSDSPGGSAMAGSFTVLFGAFILTTNSNRKIQALAVAGIAAGVFCIYICEIRSIMITTAISVTAMVVIQVLQRRMSRAAASMIVLPLIVLGAFSWTNTLSKGRATERISTLATGSTVGVYYQSRGRFIEHSLIEELPKYPLGAGLGRYGMMFGYFGDPTLKNSEPLWVEVQLTAWLYDGGLPVLLFGYCALLGACYVSYQITLDGEMHPLILDCAAIITALNIGWLAWTFSYPLFLGQNGMLFWLLNVALVSATTMSRGMRRPPRIAAQYEDPTAAFRS